MPNSASDELRQKAIERLHLLLYRNDETLIRITRLTAHALNAPYAAFSVLGEGDQEYVATHNFDAETLPYADTLCSVSVLNEHTLNITDTFDHPDYAKLPVTQGPEGTRFYVGVPVKSPDNWVIGVLCVFGPEPRTLNAAELEDLHDFARLVEESLLMRSAAIKDDLTGLYNRRYFWEQMDREWRRAMREQLPISLVMFDLDHFKPYNDGYGHACGDEALRAVAAVFMNKIRRPGDIVARIGGVEFAAILLPSSDAGQALSLVNSILTTIHNLRIKHENTRSGFLTASAGIATVANLQLLKTLGTGKMLALANQALYEAKKNGRNQACAYEGATEQ